MRLDVLSRWFPAVKMAYRNLSRTKVRSGLATLGIVVGVVAIASLGVFGTTLQHSVTNSLGDIGNQVIVSPSAENGVTELTDRDVRQIRRASSTATVTPLKQRSEVVEFGRGDRSLYTVVGVANPGEIYAVSEGKIPDPLRSGALVGQTVAEERDIGPGSTIVVNGSTERVRAVIESKSGNVLIDPSNSIVVPASRYGSGYDQVIVAESSGSAANETAMEIRNSLNERKERVSVRELSEFVNQIDGVFSALNAFLLGVGSISLFVAAISILNVMLMSTVERREEIGVLRAVGFQKRQVLVVMLTEAVLLGVLGGLIGVVLSLVAGLAINQVLLDDALALLRTDNLKYVLLAFAFGVLASVLSGLYPAWKAANEEPVEALRS